jgi:Spy/CpxP family protein refolding chaperone
VRNWGEGWGVYDCVSSKCERVEVWTPDKEGQMITEETRRAFGLHDTELLKWRQGGRSQKVKTFLLVAGVAIMILLGIKMLSGAPLPQYGGRRMHRQMTPEQQLERMTKQLNLTDDQQAKIKPILEDQHKQIMALRQDTSISREDRFTKFREIRKQTHDKIYPILNADQQKKMDEMQQRRQERFERNRSN